MFLEKLVEVGEVPLSAIGGRRGRRNYRRIEGRLVVLEAASPPRLKKVDLVRREGGRVLNSSGHVGRVWVNRIGIVGLIYAMAESGIVAATDRDDVWTSVAAGLGTGAVCRAARGVRSAAVAGALGGLVAGAVVAGKQAIPICIF
ncbi:unnamed protein product [Linum tenue]|uniref:Uncharacterized protein n=1 Tax=Linum tenue TaxID=586396 RepID=A0AAV0HSP1_9ROSI|nr:unnamed protein product [Linum tenue]